MKFKISIGLNIILAAALVVMHAGHQIHNHYYQEFTGSVLNQSAVQIQAGNSKWVGEVLRVHGSPTYGDLISIYEALKTEKQTGLGQSDGDNPPN